MSTIAAAQDGGDGATLPDSTGTATGSGIATGATEATNECEGSGSSSGRSLQYAMEARWNFGFLPQTWTPHERSWAPVEGVEGKGGEAATTGGLAEGNKGIETGEAEKQAHEPAAAAAGDSGRDERKEKEVEGVEEKGGAGEGAGREGERQESGEELVLQEAPERKEGAEEGSRQEPVEGQGSREGGSLGAAQEKKARPKLQLLMPSNGAVQQPQQQGQGQGLGVLQSPGLLLKGRPLEAIEIGSKQRGGAPARRQVRAASRPRDRGRGRQA